MKFPPQTLHWTGVRCWAAALTFATGVTLGLPSASANGLHGWHPEFNLSLTALGTYATGIIDADPSSAEIPAYDPLTRRVFVVNGANKAIDVLDIRDPKNPAKLFSIDVSQFGAPNSVAVKSGIVAIAVENGADKQAPGWALLYDVSGRFLNRLTAGALPDMVTFSPDGSWILLANEGEPSADYQNDPEGSITAIPLGNCDFTPFWVNILRAKTLKQSHVRQIGFTQFNQATLDPSIRIYGPGATVAQDLEPEYIAVSPDSKTAMVTLQENNALAEIDLGTGQVIRLLGLGFKDHSLVSTEVSVHEFGAMPSIGSTAPTLAYPNGQELFLGGFSGLWFEGIDPVSGEYRFVTHTDRGPNGEPAGGKRPFLLPDFAPQIVRFTLDPATGALTLTEQLALKDAAGAPLTGLPNTAVVGGNANTAHNDELPVDLFGNALPLDPLGGDFEGLVVDPNDGSFWLCDEYRPALYQFAADGKLIQRFVPSGTAAAAGQPAGTFGTEALPEVLAQRRQNRGFEALAWSAGKLYAWVQSPLRNPTTAANSVLNTNRSVRVLEFNPVTRATKQYLHVMDNPDLGASPNTRADKIGDAVALGGGEFLVVERDDDTIFTGVGATVEKKIYRISLAGATDITTKTGLFGGKTVDQLTLAELAANSIVPVGKVLHVDLNAAGYNEVEKVEGLALIDPGTIAVINDNDFGVAGITLNGDGTFNPDPTPDPIQVGIIRLGFNGLDASDGDKLINIRQWPVFGMYQPDAISAFKAAGQTYYIAGNEGDAREYIYEDENGDEVVAFAEELRVGNSRYKLDPDKFPFGPALKNNANPGRLTATTATGDTDGDGDFDAIHVLGGRSFSIYDRTGNRIYDSADLLEQITALADPANFNSNNDANGSFDTRSDNKGPEPEGVAVGEVLGRPFAFIGLERVGGVAVFDLSNPQAPRFVQYLNNRDFSGDLAAGTAGDSGPEGLAFIPWWQSPTWKPLLVVANEVSGTTTIYELAVSPATAP